MSKISEEFIPNKGDIKEALLMILKIFLGLFIFFGLPIIFSFLLCWIGVIPPISFLISSIYFIVQWRIFNFVEEKLKNKIKLRRKKSGEIAYKIDTFISVLKQGGFSKSFVAVIEERKGDLIENMTTAQIVALLESPHKK